VKFVTLASFAVGMLLASSPASAQTYDPSHPVCIHIYGERMGDRIDCIYSSLEQCAATASGLPATCLINPYYVNARKLVPTRHHRGRRSERAPF
jgi:hypothetical protein